MSDPVVITVYGQPAPQGSKRAFQPKDKAGEPVGKPVVIESSHDRVKSWRQAVMDAAAQVKAWPALDVPVRVHITFWMRRPAGHYRTGRNSAFLRDSAPAFPGSRPDLAKLARSTEDALTDAAIWRDDSLICDERLLKMYVGRLEPIGARIEITPLPEHP